MTTLIAISVILAISLIVSGWVLAHEAGDEESGFARQTNGRNTDDGLKAHRRNERVECRSKRR